MKIFGKYETEVAGDFNDYLEQNPKAVELLMFFTKELMQRQEVEFNMNRYMQEVHNSTYEFSKKTTLGEDRLIEEANNEWARIYDSMGENHIAWVESRNWNNEVYLLGLVTEHLEDKDKVIVDAGCGSGLDLNALASIFPEKQFIGFDISKVQIELATEMSRRNGITNTTFINSTYTSTTLDDASVDVFLLKRNLSPSALIPDRSLSESIGTSDLLEVNEEINRVLKTDGNLVKTQVSLGGTIGRINPGFEYLSAFVWPEGDLDDPFEISFLYGKE